MYVIVDITDGRVQTTMRDEGTAQTERDAGNRATGDYRYAVIPFDHAEPLAITATGTYVSDAGLRLARANKCDRSCPYCGDPEFIAELYAEEWG